MKQRVLETVFNMGLIRFAAAIAFSLRGGIFLLLKRNYSAMNDFCWVARVSGVACFQSLANKYVKSMVSNVRRYQKNILTESYLASSHSSACASLYSLAGGHHDIFRDLIVLKRSRPEENGVILLKYARTFDAVIALFDVTRLSQRYLFVLEPCWSGYCDPSILMYLIPGRPVFVQCFTEEDFRFIESIGNPLIPIRMGPADWVDADLFVPSKKGEKIYDLVMVANWAPHKRHSVLFQALNKLGDRKIRVLLIGFPLGRWTMDDVKRQATIVKSSSIEIDTLEKVPPGELAKYVSQCKIFVFLSRKEGDNKALVEAMFVDVPAIVFDKTIGGARSRINPSTGILASDEELSDKISYMLEHYKDFHPRSWALQHTGSSISTRVLNDLIKSTIIQAGGTFTENIHEKTNSPNLAYKDPTIRGHFREDYEFILSCRHT